MKFEAILASIGDFGLYQKIRYFLLCLVAIPHVIQVLGIIFTMGNQDHRCSIPSLPNDTYSLQGDWHHQIVNEWIPKAEEGDGFSSCEIYVEDPVTHLPTNDTTACSQYVYDTSVFLTTFTSDENLVCGRKILKTYANMLFMAGMLLGSIIMGTLSDAIGRKKTLMLCIVGTLTASVSTTFVQSYIVFVILRLVDATFSMGLFIVAFVIGMEIVGPKTRKFAGVMIELFWVLGLLINVVLAYFIREWRTLQIITSAPIVLLLSYAFLIHESPRWLIRKGRLEEASAIIQKAATMNKVCITDDMVNLEYIENDGPTAKLWHMFTSKVLLVRTLVLLYAWFACTLVYFGLTLNVHSLSGDIYTNQALFCISEGLAYVLCIFLLDRLGRRVMLIGSLSLAGLACLATMFPVMYGGEDQGWVTVALSLLGKFGSSITFAVVYIYTAEVFPTTTRNSGIGLCSFTARIGGILSPYIADLGNIVGGNLGVALPLVIFGGSTLLAGFLSILLPETTNRILPESIQDAKDFGRTSKSSSDIDNEAVEKYKPTNDSKGNYGLINRSNGKILIPENGHNGAPAAMTNI